VPPEQYPKIWRDVESTAEIHTAPFINEAVRLARSFCQPEGELHTLVTGSQHLVGGVLLMVEKQP
jgi:folylpolyglutamate synthase